MSENTSALKMHFLSSILPYQKVWQPEVILKTKQFYKPEEFIWNNPHRTSKRLFPYFHQGNQQYEQKVKPIIEHLQERDKITFEQQRIKKLTNLRHETRQKFFQRQKVREELEARSNSRRKSSSISELNSKTSREQKNQNCLSLKGSLFRGGSSSSHISANIQKTYQKGVQNYDANLNEIKKLVSEQVIKNHFKIRSQFQKRKQTNDILNSSTSILKRRKSVGALKYDNFLQQ